jgi:DNA polymerase-3 subunit epsilon
MKYYTLNTKTSNFDYSSLCQICLMKFDGEKIVSKWQSFVNPESYFDEWHLERTGITPEMVEDAPIFIDIYSKVVDFFSENLPAFHHTPYDRIVLSRVCEEHELEPITIEFIDTAKIVRRIWDQFKKSGFSRNNLSEFLNIPYEENDIVQASMLTSKIVLAALTEKDTDIAGLKNLIKKRITPRKPRHRKYLSLEPNPEGIFFGDTVVFTGKLSITRNDISQIAAEAGFKIGGSVTSKTDVLVVGIQDETLLNGYKKSSKHRKAEKLLEEGKNIEIMTESDFNHLLREED